MEIERIEGDSILMTLEDYGTNRATSSVPGTLMTIWFSVLFLADQLDKIEKKIGETSK